MHAEYKVVVPFSKINDKVYEVGTSFQNTNGQLFNKIGNYMCHVHSEHSRECLVGNDDGQWKKRGDLIHGIKGFFFYTTREDFDKRVDPAIERLWNDPFCMKYNQNALDPTSPWIWNDDFYCAPIPDLEYIVKVLNA